MKITKYPDGTSYVTTTNGNGKSDHNITFRINTYEDLWHLNQFVDAYRSAFSCPPVITIPNLIDAQADRRFNKLESSGLKLVCDFISRMKADFKIFHPHNPEAVEALLPDAEIIDNSEFIVKVLNKHWESQKVNLKSPILMSSDAGGFKPLSKLCDKINWQGEMYSASKARSWDEKNGTKFVQQIDRDDFEGKDIFIVDDISVYGGTFKGLSKLLKERNCGKLYLAVSHMTVQNLGEDPVTNYFDKIFTTNSKFENYSAYHPEPYDRTYQPENLEIIKIFEE